MPSYPGLQYTLFVTSSAALLTYQCRVLPMDEASSQRLEIFNEATIFLVGALLAPYSASQFTPEQSEVNNKLGWAIAGLTLANVLVNELLMVWQVL